MRVYIKRKSDGFYWHADGFYDAFTKNDLPIKLDLIEAQKKFDSKLHDFGKSINVTIGLSV